MKALGLIGIGLIGICLIVAFILAQTSPPREAYSKALASGLTKIPAAREFRDLFADSRCEYSYYTGQYGSPTLTCKTLLHQRYVFAVQVNVKFDDTRTKVVSYAEPVFDLWEVESVQIIDGGGGHIRYGELQRKFGAQEWKKIREGKGDFSVVGVNLAKGKPVSDIGEAW